MLASAIQIQPDQVADGFKSDRWTLSDWNALIAGSTHAEIAVRGWRPVAAAGFSEPWDGLAIAWAILGTNAGPSLVPITRRVRRAMELHPRARRFQFTVRANFKPGHRWARMLGCQSEGTLRRYSPDGSDHVMYARIFDR